MTKIRIICSDPNATDCSSDDDDETKSPKHVVYNIELTPKIPTPDRNPKKSPYKFVYWKKTTKKWTSEFRDPVTKKRYYLGTFETAESAHQAYCAKQRERESKKKRPKGESKKKRPKDEASGSESGLVQNDCLSDERVQPIRNPIRATRLRKGKECRERCGCCGGSDEPKKKPPKTGSLKRTWDRKGIKEKEACKKEKLEVEFSSSISNEMASAIIDENGYLLGEFSKIDDLTIC